VWKQHKEQPFIPLNILRELNKKSEMMYKKDLFFIFENVTLSITFKENMSASTKLSSSVKAICYLAESYPNAKTSKEIAKNIGVNSSKLRQLLSMLAKQNIVVSTQGKTGGFTLNKSPELIHLQEVYCSIEDRKAFHLDVTKRKEKKKDRIHDFNNYFLGLFADVQIEIEDMMRNISIQSIMDKLSIKSNYKENQ
jgi:Rrf2 family protein